MTIALLPLIFIVGIVVLYFGAEAMLHGAVTIARRVGISQLAIGLTLVAFGTSCPELSLDITAALRGTTDLAFGDLVGSNIANIGLILAVAAIVCPLRVQMRLLWAELPIMIAVSLIVLGLAGDGVISRRDGLLLVTGFVLFVGYSFHAARLESARVQREIEEAVEAELTVGVARSWLFLVLGLGGLVAGAQLMVYSAVEIARLIGISQVIIGLTIVALGTSLPELATSVVAARRKDADIVVGNVIGSNIFNLLLILGVVAVIQPVTIEQRSLYVELPVMIAFAVLLVPIMFRGKVVTSGEGFVLIMGMGAFLGWQLYSVLAAR